jgi:endogenous inhibitor of DNA gyrase (YacG/DUF329 family)
MADKLKKIYCCPQCRQSVAWEGNPYRPFCSERCQLTDLGNWADERYAIAAEPCSEALEEFHGENNKSNSDS